MSCHQFVADQATRHPVRLLCRVMGVSRSPGGIGNHRRVRRAISTLQSGSARSTSAAARPTAALAYRPNCEPQDSGAAAGESPACCAMLGCEAFMASDGDAYDNAVVEAFFSSLKTAPTDRQVWPTRAAARLAIFEYIEGWYNQWRRHSTLGYLAPVAFEALASRSTAT